MLVFWKERLVFLAVPKTGTTAIEEVLGPRASLTLRDPPGLKHTTAQKFHRFVLPYLLSGEDVKFETMAVLRHPVDWLGSWYRYRSRPALDGKPNSTRDISFDEFVIEYCKGKPAPYANVGAQARFVQDNHGARLVTHLFRYEEPARLTGFLEARLKLRLDLPRVNVSPLRAVELSPEVLAHLQTKRAAEFAVWEEAGQPAAG